MQKKQQVQRLQEELSEKLCACGYPYEFGDEIGRMLGSEKALRRMLGYLSHVDHPKAEDIADEAVAILEERQAWINKKKAEYANSRRNEILNQGFDDER